MTIYVNDKATSIEQGVTLYRLLEDYDLQEQSGIAVAVNDQVVPQQKWKEYTLNDEDNILVITASQGG